jgi:hypothetical protein
VSSYARGDLGGMASTAMGLFKKAVSGDEVYQKNLRTKTSAADVIMWSGSKDSQTSYVNTLPAIPEMAGLSPFLASASRLGPPIAPAPLSQAQLASLPPPLTHFSSQPQPLSVLSDSNGCWLPLSNSHFEFQHATAF